MTEMFSIRSTPSILSICLSRCLSVSAIFRKSHYEALGLTPNATQGDIKTAYYKMSMEYHPDKNKGSEGAAQKFRDITAAYEVLGNLRLRKLYDKGILHTAGPEFAQPTEETSGDETQSKFYKSREQRSRAPPPSGKTPVYNFDEWTRMHYGASFARRAAAKSKYEMKVQEHINYRQTLYIELSFLAVIVIIFTVALTLSHKNYDVVESKNVSDTIDNKNSISHTE